MSTFLRRRPLAFVLAPGSSFIGLSLRKSNCCPGRGSVRNMVGRRVPKASIEQEVSQKLKEAMKSKDAAALKALRGIRASFLTALKEAGAEDTLSDEVAIAQLRKLAKMRKESITMFKEGGRVELADAEEKELAVIEHWLPSLADAEQMTIWAKEAIEKTGASKKGDMGKVMGYVFCHTLPVRHREIVLRM